MKPEKRQLTEADYDFGEIKSKDELHACYWYEYARESRAAISEIAAVRMQKYQKKFSTRVQDPSYIQIFLSLSLVNGFPHTPWKNLSDIDRRMMLNMMFLRPHLLRYDATSQNPPLTFVWNESGTTTLDAWQKKIRDRLPSVPDSEPIKFGFFRVNLKYGHPVLIEEFEKKLRLMEGKAMLQYPPLAKKKNIPPGRKSIGDKLNALAAMRLRYLCGTFSEAQKIIQTLKKPNGVFYANRHNFNRACKTAIKHFETLFGRLDSEKPIHFTEGWRGGIRK
jgi:hypothetical protein